MNRIIGLPRLAIGGNVRNKYFIRIGGQSNAEGIMLNTTLPTPLARRFEKVFIWWNENESSGNGEFQKLQAGVNNQRSTSAAGSNRLQWYGAEIAIADKFERLHPNDELYIAKYAVGSSSVAVQAGTDWNTSNSGEALDIGIDSFYVPAASDLSGIIDLGMIWMQGEQDAADASASATVTFRTNSVNTFSAFRTRLSSASMPIYVCRLNASIARDPTQLANVRTAQGTSSPNLTHIGSFPNNHFFDTDSYSIIPGDTVHFQPFPFGIDLYTSIGL